jgi:hypothetical protein
MISSLKHNSPLFYYLFIYLGGGCVATLLLYLALINCSSCSNKAHYFVNAVYWEARAFAYDGPDRRSETPSTHFIAKILGITDKGHVLFLRGAGVIEAKLADLNITDIPGTMKLINQYKGKRLFVDYYQFTENNKSHKYVVLWNEFDAPINLEIVERQLAVPDDTPSTNVVNILMASYFWKLFIG